MKKLNWKRVAGWGFFPLMILLNGWLENDFQGYWAFLALHLAIMLFYIEKRGVYFED